MNHTVLLVEDDDDLRESMRDLLEDSAEIHVTGKEPNWSKIELKTPTASLTLNRQVRVKAKRLSGSIHALILPI